MDMLHESKLSYFKLLNGEGSIKARLPEFYYVKNRNSIFAVVGSILSCPFCQISLRVYLTHLFHTIQNICSLVGSKAKSLLQ